MPAGLVIKDRYEVRSVLGRGGMGVVYQAYDTLMRREVALKTLRDVPSGVFIDLFYRECSVLAGMVHPNVVEVFDMGEFDEGGVSKPYFVMPLLPGQTLHELIYSANVPVSVIRGVDIISQCCRGLQAAHDRGLLHRDIKPRNIFVMRDDAVKVIDFGVAQLLGNNTTGLRGTPQYMSPEQITFKPLTNKSDVFSLATVAYEALTATHPFLRDPGRRDSDADIAWAITSYIPPLVSDLNPGVTRAVSVAIAKAMMKDPRARFESAASFAEALQRALRNEGDTVPSLSTVQLRLTRARRSFEKSDLQFAAEILTQLEAEGHSDPEIANLRKDIDEAIQRERTERLVGAATQYFESEEYTLAAKKVQEVLEIDPAHAEALALNARIETVLTEQKISELLSKAQEHLEKSAFTNARQAAQDALKLRPNDTRARQFLGEIDAKQKEALRARQEQERLFQSAQSSWLEGDIEAAIAELEKLAEVSRRSSDNRDRVNEYKEFYRRVRKEADDLSSSIQQAGELISRDDCGGAQKIHDRLITRYPKHKLLQTLAQDIVRYRQEEETRYERGVADRLEKEPLLPKRIEIVSAALKTYPNNHFLRDQADRLRGLQERVQSLANEARLLEKQKQFEKAVECWKSLGQIYPAYPGLDGEIGRASAAFEQKRAAAKSAFLAQISAALEAENYGTADNAFELAEREFPGDTDIAGLKSRRALAIQKSEQAAQLLLDANRFVSEGKFSEAAAALSEAAIASRELKLTSQKVSAAAVQQAQNLVRQDWRAAETIIDKVFGSDRIRAVPTQLREEIRKQQREGEIRSVLNAIRHDCEHERLSDAQARAKQALQTYPGEARVEALLKAIEAQIAEVRRKEQRNASLAELERLQRELRSGSSGGGLKQIGARAKSLGESFRGDAEIELHVREIAADIARYTDANAALAAGDYSRSANLCDERIKQVPDHQLFLALMEDAESRERQQAADYLAHVEQRLRSESVLESRVAILNEASQRYPGEPFFKEELELVRNKQAIVGTLAERAKKLQQNGSISEALEEWRSLETIYPLYPGLSDSIAACRRTLEQQREEKKRKSISDIEAALRQHNYDRACDLAEQALQGFSDDGDLLRLRQKAEQRRAAWIQSQASLDRAAREFQAGNLPVGFKTIADMLREVADEPAIKTAAASLLIEHASGALPHNLDLSEAMLAEALAADPQQHVSKELQAALDQARRQHAFDQCVEKVKAQESARNLPGALAAIREFLSRFPRDQEGSAWERRIIEQIEAEERKTERERKLAELRRIRHAVATVVPGEVLVDLHNRVDQIIAAFGNDEKVARDAERTSAILSRLIEINTLLDTGQFAAAAAASTKASEDFPDLSRFNDLLAESVFRQNEAAAEYLREVEQKLSATKEFKRQAEILREALERYPEEPYYHDELHLVENKQALMDSAVARARDLETHQLYEEARRQWEELGRLYPWFSIVRSEVERISQICARAKAERRDAWIREIQRLIDVADYDAAQKEVDAALIEFPDEGLLRQAVNQIAKARAQHAVGVSAFHRGEELLASGKLAEACDLLAEAFRLCSPASGIAGKVIDSLIAAAEQRLSENWQQSEILLKQIHKLQPSAKVPRDLISSLEARRRDQEIEDLLRQLERAEAKQDWNEAGRILALGNRFGDDSRLEAARQRVKEAQERIEAERKRAEILQCIEAFRLRLDGAIKKRQIAKLQSSLAEKQWLKSEDEQIRSAAQLLAEELDRRLASAAAGNARRDSGKQLVSSSPEATSPVLRELPESLQAARRRRFSPVFAAIAVAALVAAALVMYWLSSPTSKVKVQVAIEPEHASLAVGSYSCITPDCNLFLARGHYEARVSKEGYDSVTIPIDIDGGKKSARLDVSLNRSKPVVQTAGDTPALGTLLINVGLADAKVLIDEKTSGATAKDGSLRTTVPPGEHKVQAVKDGYNPSDSVRVVAVATSETPVRLKLTPQSGFLEIRGALPGTQIALDEKQIGVIPGSRFFKAPLQSGDHTFDISRAGFIPRRIQRRVRPGESVLLAGSDVDLTPAIPSEILQESKDWDRIASTNSISDLQAFLQKHPGGSHSSLAAQKLEYLSWQAVPKASTTALQQFLAKYPQGKYSGDAQQILANLQENNDWSATDRSNPDSLRSFLTKHPDSIHAQAAEQLLTQLSKPKNQNPPVDAEEQAWNAIDRNNLNDLENFTARFPSGKHHAEAANAIAALTSRNQQTAETTEVVSALRSFADAWNARDINAIVAAQPGLKKKELRDELAGIRSLQMTITPVSPPAVNGDHATVVCQRVVIQTFSDGRVRQTPSNATFTLAKRSGRWMIESVQ